MNVTKERIFLFLSAVMIMMMHERRRVRAFMYVCIHYRK